MLFKECMVTNHDKHMSANNEMGNNGREGEMRSAEGGTGKTEGDGLQEAVGRGAAGAGFSTTEGFRPGDQNNMRAGSIARSAENDTPAACAPQSGGDGGHRPPLQLNEETTRVGKVARLPRKVREELNQRLQDGEEGSELL